MIVKLTVWTLFVVSKLKRRLQRLVRVCNACQNATLLEISFCGSYLKVATMAAILKFFQGHCPKPYVQTTEPCGRIGATWKIRTAIIDLHWGKSATIRESNHASDVVALCVVLCTKKLNFVSQNWRMKN